ncbi:MAG: hypothetical protein ACLT4C_03715 [Butyricicoccus sp.]
MKKKLRFCLSFFCLPVKTVCPYSAAACEPYVRSRAWYHRAEHNSGLIDYARIRIAAADHDPTVLHAVHHGIRVIDEEIQFVHQAAVVVADRVGLLGHAAADGLRLR